MFIWLRSTLPQFASYLSSFQTDPSKLATFTCIAMYVSYIPQIISNFSGDPVSPLQPLVAMINGILWTGYGWFKTYKDWPVIISNVPGVVFGFITVLTVYIH
ncbi:SWEET family sugar transporter [Lactiplantibacillus plantarum]|uniref:SWEET family sugar transporter n=1 Tax=Lactiplantibacillus plantarum TaxID=1590 RepID=UPI0007BBA674|nr:SWEET family sugar transporter [Lactiplantibacillus plantarum]KZU82546.1 Small conserved membrane protein [Lactiplantibacillus plantarum]